MKLPTNCVIHQNGDLKLSTAPGAERQNEMQQIASTGFDNWLLALSVAKLLSKLIKLNFAEVIPFGDMPRKFSIDC